MKYVGLDWAYRTAQWCALTPDGEIAGEGRIAADRDELTRLVLELGDEVTACLEMMSGALWARDQLIACGWQVEVATNSENVWNGRPISLIVLAEPLDVLDATPVSRIELIPPVHQRVYRMGLERLGLSSVRTSTTSRECIGPR